MALTTSVLAPVEDRLDRLIPKEDEFPFKAARYALFSGGKRLRPFLTLSVCETALDAAAAVELIHTYSLIHDDMPCMDDDDMRRGRPSLHKAFDEGQALLAGDYLQILAFDVIANSCEYQEAQKVEMIKVLTKACGASGMIGGQAQDLLSATLDEKMLIEMHRGKTGALFSASLTLGAIAKNLPNDEKNSLSRLGEVFGIAYQLSDDLADGDFSIEEIRLRELFSSYAREALDLAKNIPKLYEFIQAQFRGLNF